MCWRARAGNRWAIARAGSNLGNALYWSARYEEAYALQREILAIYLDLGDRQGLSTIYFQLGLAETFLGRYTEARVTFTSALAEARAISFALEVGSALWGLILIDVAERAYADARSRGEEAIAIYMRLGEHFFLSLIHGLCALAARGMGVQQQARQHAVAALRAALPGRVWLATIHALCAIALLLADSGAPERSAELYALARERITWGTIPGRGTSPTRIGSDRRRTAARHCRRSAGAWSPA